MATPRPFSPRGAAKSSASRPRASGKRPLRPQHLSASTLEHPMPRLTLAQANRIIDSALSTARQRGHRPMAVVVLDDAGQTRAVQREDGASEFRVAIATGKAWAAVS